MVSAISHFAQAGRIASNAAAPYQQDPAEVPGSTGTAGLGTQQNMAKSLSRRSFLTLHGALLAALLFTLLAQAATLPPPVRDEIDSLLSRLAASGCQFRRNGAWYTAAEAQAHLRRKLDYLVDKGAVASTEQFIERAASRSSVSGQAYQVRCGGTPPVTSSSWLYAELRVLRSAPTMPK
jgi:Family of unknown function (DUF5329)